MHAARFAATKVEDIRFKWPLKAWSFFVPLFSFVFVLVDFLFSHNFFFFFALLCFVCLLLTLFHHNVRSPLSWAFNWISSTESIALISHSLTLSIFLFLDLFHLNHVHCTQQCVKCEWISLSISFRPITLSAGNFDVQLVIEVVWLLSCFLPLKKSLFTWMT